MLYFSTQRKGFMWHTR